MKYGMSLLVLYMSNSQDNLSLNMYIYLFNCRYPVAPFIPKMRICFSCFRVGYLSRTYKSRPRCLYCGESAHSSEICPLKQALPKYINCKGDHLATSHNCIRVIEHKMAHSLAATENISFLDALRSVNSSSSPTSSTSSFSDPRFDFRNFLLLSKSRSSYSPPQFFSINRFSSLSNLSPPGDSSLITKPFSSILKHPASSVYRPAKLSQQTFIYSPFIPFLLPPFQSFFRS